MAMYGIPYMGSKGDIAELICGFLPTAENFYDLFGGGFAITHCMFRFPKKYKQLHFNEINADVVDLIRQAIRGRFNYDTFKPEWIDRDTFLKNKDSDAYTRIIWSFGNGQRNYLFGKKIEKDKHSLHNAVVFNQFDDNAIELLGIREFKDGLSIRQRRLICRRIITTNNKRIDLQQLQQLERLERLERLRLTSLSYESVPIKENSIIYCDPPYKNAVEYNVSFNHDKFYDWAQSQSQPVFISEYSMPKHFEIAFSVTKGTSFSGKGFKKSKPEKIFVNDSAKKLLHEKGLRTFTNG